MADQNADQLILVSDRLFSKKMSLDSLRQRLAEEFFPERANFNSTRIDGDEYQRNSYESVPALNRRTLADAIGALTRPKQQQWMKVRPDDKRLHTDRVLVWSDWATEQIHRMLYNRMSGFHRSMRMGDNDIVSFGDGVASVTEDDDRSGKPVFDWHHLRDCVWTRDRRHRLNRFDRKWMVSLSDFVRMWGESKLPPARLEQLKQSPFDEIEVRHIVLDAYDYEGIKGMSRGKQWASIYVCPESRTVLNPPKSGYFEFPYIVRPWESNDYSQYAYSPAAMLGLCDARLLQSQAAIILDAGERIVDPPLIATQEAILQGPYSHAGSITMVDAQYDERLGAVLRPLETAGNLNIGLDMKVDTREVLAAAWYINKLNLPTDSDMTAYEVGERVSEYIRSIGPVIEPFEEHNQMVLDVVFSQQMRLGRLGGAGDIPLEIMGAEIGFEIEGPVRAAYARQKTVKARETWESAKGIAEIRPDFLDNIDVDQLGRDGIAGIGGEQNWLKPVELVTEKRQADAAAMQAQRQAEEAQQAIGMAKDAASVLPAAAAANLSIPDVRQGMLPAPGMNDNGELPEGLEEMLAG